jgi:trehalose-6-phosphate synthase
MVHADVVGFHSFDHARHFLNATKRILGLHHESMVGGLIGIKVGKKTVLVSMHNVSIEPVQLDGKFFAFHNKTVVQSCLIEIIPYCSCVEDAFCKRVRRKM